MKKLLLASAISFIPVISHATWTSNDESFSLGADVELNFDIIDNQHGISLDNNNEVTMRTNTYTQLNDDSRVKFIIEWQNKLNGGRFISAKAEPLFSTDATYYADDIYLKLGQEKLWAFQIGRFEAMDLFPLGKDVAVFYAAGSDGIGSGVYYYMAKEARGRSNRAGQARIVGEMNNWTAELAAIYGNTAELLASSTIYLNGVNPLNDLTSTNNSFMLRPAVNYKTDSGFLSISFGGEYELKKDSAVLILRGDTAATTPVIEETLNLSDRYGLAATATMTFQNDLVWNNSIAMQDSKHLWKIYTGNTNIVFQNAYGLGVSYVKNNLKHDANHPSTDMTKNKDISSYVVYAAYTTPIFDLNNASLSFALSYSATNNAFGKKISDPKNPNLEARFRDEKTAAFRIRFNYEL